MSRRAIGVDVGSSTAKVLRGEVRENTFVVHGFACVENPDHSLAGGWERLAAAHPKLLKGAPCRVGLTGREVNVRYTRVPRLPDWQLRKLMRFEAEEVGGQSESALASDFNVLPEIPEIEGEDVVLLCMARESLLEQHLDGLRDAGGTLDAFSPNAIGLYNAFLQYGVVLDDTVLLANIGRENVDVVLVRGTDLVFARNMSGGSRLFDDAILSRFDVEPERAERFKIEEGTLDLTREFADATQEKAARAMTAPAGQLLSLLQSATAFAKSQVKLGTLKLDRVLLCGGGSALEGLPEYLGRALDVPVERFDPFLVVDTSKLEADAARELEAQRLEAVCALGLATMGSDERAWSIEILPASVQRQRAFRSGTAFLIAAAALCVLFLGLLAWQQSRALGDLTAEARGLESRYRRADAQHREASALLVENARLAELAQELFAIEGAGEQTVRALAVLDRELPAAFWLTRMTLATDVDEGLGIARDEELPILRLSGRAREGTQSPAVQWGEFVTRFRAALPAARVEDRMGHAEFTLDMTSLAPDLEDEAPVEEAAR